MPEVGFTNEDESRRRRSSHFSQRGKGARLGNSLERGQYGFRAHERLHVSAEYQRVRKRGRRLRTRHFILSVAENGLSFHRLGTVVQKRYWRAVERNLIKRRLREWFRLNKSRIPLPGKDIVAVARPGAERLSAAHVVGELNAAFHNTG
ncbi:MAG: ribonuclease P protein component [Deltaproteobacteria bacterium]|nr:ribonuclease P protein component [Deltaproteobacteria bacterium]